MKPCANLEALEAMALADANDASDAWLEAHVGECAECAAELDRLLEERDLFVRRARALDSLDLQADVPLGVGGVFAELDRRRERFRKTIVIGSMVAAAAACVAMAFAPITSASSARVRAFAESSRPAQAELGATASWDDAPMTSRLAACMPSDVDHSECPVSTRDTEHARLGAAANAGVLASSWADFGGSSSSSSSTSGGAQAAQLPTVCIAGVTCSVDEP